MFTSNRNKVRDVVKRLIENIYSGRMKLKKQSVLVSLIWAGALVISTTMVCKTAEKVGKHYEDAARHNRPPEFSIPNRINLNIDGLPATVQVKLVPESN